jgi:hypothetical protein
MKPFAATFDRKTNTELLEQLLLGLAALHRAEIAHGDLRPDNIFLDESNHGDKTPVAWIGNAALGGLASWSKQRFFDDESRDYFPPEWKNNTGEPSFHADLYALGVLAHKLMHGDKSQPVQRTWFWEWMTGTAASNIARRLLLRDKAQRPHDAQVALEQFRRLRAWTACRGWIVSLTCLLLLCMGLFFTAWSQSNAAKTELAAATEAHKQDKTADKNRLKQVEEQRDARESERDTARTERDTARAVVKELTDKNHELEIKLAIATGKNPPEPPEVPELVKAQAAWKDIWENTKTDEQQKFAAAKKQYEKFPKGTKGEKEAARNFGKWYNQARGLHSKSEFWFKSEPGIESLYQAASKNPWNETAFQKVQKHREDLEKAGDVWNDWAMKNEYKFEDLQGLLPAYDPAVRSILDRWLAQFKAKKDWTIRFTKGRGPAGKGTYRGIWVKGDAWSEGNWHDWTTETKYDYPRNSLHDKVRFNWEVGDPLIIAMVGPRVLGRGGYRPYILYQTISGPLALWQSHKLGQVSQDGVLLQFEVLDCPGPPRNFNKDVSTEGVLPSSPSKSRTASQSK